MELQKPQSDDLSDSCDQVYLKSTWVVTSLRHPVLRLLCCSVHLVFSFYLGVTSPLLTSLQSPPRFPVYGNLVKTATTGLTWQKIVFQLALSLSLLIFLRTVAYPRLVQHLWNWKTSYHHATQRFSRLSWASASDTRHSASQSGTANGVDVVALHTLVAGGVGGTPVVRLTAWNVGLSKGSWTFVAATFPFLWAAVMHAARIIAHEFALEEWLFPEDMNETWSDVTQNKLQQALSTTFLTLSCLRILVTLDWILQDREYTRVLFGGWLLPVRRVYREFLAVRILWCWLPTLGVVIGGVYFGGVTIAQNEWIRWKLEKEDGVNDMESWLTNASWNTLLSSLIIALDLLWIVQVWDFPSFVSPVGLRMLGLDVDHIKLRFPFQLVFSSKWTGGFLVMALLLPLEICQFLQVANYSPGMYSQYVHATSFRVFPLNATDSDSSSTDNLDTTNLLLLQAGSLSRYFPWSEWDLAHAFFVLLLATIGLIWLSTKEQCKMCFAVYLGLSGAQEKRAEALAKMNRSVLATVKRELRTQQRLRTLYKLRARSDSFCIGLAVFSVLTVWLQFRAIWRSSAKYHHDLPLQAPGEAYAALLLLITLILLHQIHYRYCVKLEIMVLRNQLPPKSPYWLWRFPRLLFLPFLVELLLCGLFLPPLMHGRVYFDEERYSLPKATLEVLPACPRPLTMTISNQSCALQYSYPLEIVNMVVLLRLYWFARVIRNQLSKQLIADKASARPAIFSGKEVPTDSLWWSFRISFALSPSKVLLTLFVTLWVSTAAAVSIFERPFPSKLDGEDHALWLTLVTMTGVGYGDAYSITLGGRIAIILGAVVGGLAFMSLMTSEFLDSLTGTKREHAVLSAMDKLKWERSLRVCGAQLIQSVWLYHQSNSTKKQCKRKLLNAVHKFKLCRKRKPLQSANASFVLQKSGLSTFYSREVETWMVSSQAETAAQLGSLEKQLDNLESSLQPLL